jgi:hypothetical protein
LLLKQDAVLSSITVLFVSVVWIPATTSAIFLLLDVPQWWIWISVLSVSALAFVGIYLNRKLSRRDAFLILSIVIGCVAAAAVVCVYIYDVSSDGRGYHTDAVLAILQRINPIYRQIPSPEPIFVNHYPKATWYFAAFVVRFFRVYQLGKIYNFLLMVACLAYARSFFQRQGLHGLFGDLLAVATAFSPVVVAQLTTFYLDSALGSLVSLVILSAVNMLYRPERFDRVVFALCASLLIGVKFTGLVYVVAISGILLLLRVLKIREPRTFGAVRLVAIDSFTVAGVLLAGTLILGFNPYVTNKQQGFHPLYPAYPFNAVPIMARNNGLLIPLEIRGQSFSRAHMLLLSLLSRSEVRDVPLTLKIPFSVTVREIRSMGAPDPRMAGWGVFFSGVTICSLTLFLFTRAWRDSAPWLLVLVMTVASFALNPMSWVARYAPQIALIPIFLVAPVLRVAVGRLLIFARLICGLLLLNCLITAGAAMGEAFILSRKLDRSFSTIAKAGGRGEYWALTTPDNVYHYEQFSGLKGVVICGQPVVSAAMIPSSAYPLGVAFKNEPQVFLLKGSCDLPPVFR